MLSHHGAMMRVALFLLRFAERQGCDQRLIDLPVGREDMADYLGLTVETVCRTLGELRNRGIIVMKGRRAIEIRNRSALALHAGKEC